VPSHTYKDVFAGFDAIGISDFMPDWPDEKDLGALEAAARKVLPQLRGGA
jgi:hypothetical protein